jgi:hypothetical protein
MSLPELSAKTFIMEYLMMNLSLWPGPSTRPSSYGRKWRPAAPAILVTLACSSLWATNYYVSPRGNDHWAGTSTSQPWKTVGRVNQASYDAGDQILFHGGNSFRGALYFTSGSRGSAGGPIVVSSYGGGVATILPGAGTGLYAYNTAGFSITNINFRGSGAGVNTKSGIMFYTDVSGGVKLDTIIISNVIVTRFGQAGVTIGSWNGATGFQNINLTYVVAHDNGDAGIQVWGQVSPTGAWYPHQNIYIGHCQAYNNQGHAGTSSASGSGILVAAANGVTIERSLAYGNGALNTSRAGPVGIWAYYSNAVTMQYNESHHNHTSSTGDGDGFDFDGGVTNSVMQYNYSHDNDGAGFLAAEYSGTPPNQNNVIRYNISQNDGRKNSSAGIMVWNGGETLSNLEVYNNTVFLSSAAVSPSAVIVLNPTANVHFRNNIFATNGSVYFMHVTPIQSGLLFQGNDYWAYSSNPVFLWGNGYYTSLTQWQSATGQETLNGSPTGYSVDPMMNTPGAGPSINNSALLNTLTAYQLLPGSPMIDSGLNLPTLFQINPGPVDFWGNAIQGPAHEIGAY